MRNLTTEGLKKGISNGRSSFIFEDAVSRIIDGEQKNSLIKSLCDWREKTSLCQIKLPKVTSCSTGGYGDKVPLVLVPLVASAGLVIPKTSEYFWAGSNCILDKLQTITGLKTSLTPQEIIDQLSKTGAAIFSPPEQVVSFFKKNSNFRGLLSKENNLDLSASIIMSFILAGGVNGVSFDIKVGEGSFVKSPKEARYLVQYLKTICNRMNIPSSFILTDMNQPLGQAVGNSLELIEAIEVLKGRGPFDVLKIALELGTEMLLLTKTSSNRAEAKERLKKKIIDGSALNKFKEIIESQKGNPRIADVYSLLPEAKEKIKIISRQNGFLHHLKMNEIRFLISELEISCMKPNESINPGSGFLIFKKIGDTIEKNDILAEVHINEARNVSLVKKKLGGIFVISKSPPDFLPLIIERIR